MSAFPYREGRLHAEGVALDELAAAVGTPFYVYSQVALEDAYDRFAGALSDALGPGRRFAVCYAVKANGNVAVIRALAARGAGADVVSEGELRRALAAGVPAEGIVFAGVGKTPAEMAFALDAGILQFNVESLPELEALSAIAAERGRHAPVALRVNPNVDARTHHHGISTGRDEDKFGIGLDLLPTAVARARELPGIVLEGLAVHIGSQLTELAPFREAFAAAARLFAEIRADGVALTRLDLGGGLGIAYHDEPPPDPAAYARAAAEATAGLEAELLFEPGRHLVGNAGLLVSRVLYVKDGATRRFLVVDAAMNDLLRPALYDAWHDILPVAAPDPEARSERVDVVGPVCETTDTFARQRPLPPMQGGDLLAFLSAGAYGAAMASCYNARALVPEVMVRGKTYATVRPRPSHDSLLAAERLPDWLAPPDEAAARGAG